MTLFVLIAAALSCNVFGAQVPLITLSDPKARCLDGSNAGYYFQKGNDENKNKYIIYLNGGGECDQETSCKNQLTGPLGSSKYFSSSTDASGWYLASDNCDVNPDFCGWNHIFDPYCTQDLHSGQVTEPTEETWGLYFSGHNVLEAILDDLDNKKDKNNLSLLNATEIIVHGMSAGGIGVWMNVDYVAKRYPSAKVTAMTVAGHYFYATYYEGINKTSSSGMSDFRKEAWDRTYHLYDAYVDEDCKKYHENMNESPGACMLSNNSLPFIGVDR